MINDHPAKSHTFMTMHFPGARAFIMVLEAKNNGLMYRIEVVEFPHITVCHFNAEQTVLQLNCPN